MRTLPRARLALLLQKEKAGEGGGLGSFRVQDKYMQDAERRAAIPGTWRRAGGREEPTRRSSVSTGMYGGQNTGVCVGGRGVHGLLLYASSSLGATEEVPAAKTCPNTTSDTSSGATAARFRTSLMTAEPRSWTGTVDKAPLKEPRAEGRRGSEGAAHGGGLAAPALPRHRRPPQLRRPQGGRVRAGPVPGQRGRATLPDERGRPSRAPRALETPQRSGGRGSGPCPPDTSKTPARCPAPETTELRRPIGSSRESASSRQPMGGSDGAVVLPREPIRAGEKDIRRDEGAGGAGEGPGRPGGPRGPQGLRLRRRTGPARHSPMMVRAADTMTTGSEPALILPRDRSLHAQLWTRCSASEEKTPGPRADRTVGVAAEAPPPAARRRRAPARGVAVLEGHLIRKHTDPHRASASTCRA